MLIYKDFHDAYLDTLKRLIEKPQFVSAPRGSKTYEILNYSFTVQDSQTDVSWELTGSPERKKTTDRYWKKELAWYLSGELHVSTAPSKFWHDLADESGYLTSNYGFMTMFDKKYENEDFESVSGIDKVVHVLKKDNNSRQAVLHYGESSHFWEGNKDTPCCVTNQFFLRDGAIHMTVYMRSNDVIKGLTYDYKWFSYIQKRISDRLGCSPGPIAYFAGSMHLYESDIDLARNILKLGRP